MYNNCIINNINNRSRCCQRCRFVRITDVAKKIKKYIYLYIKKFLKKHLLIAVEHPYCYFLWQYIADQGNCGWEGGASVGARYYIFQAIEQRKKKSKTSVTTCTSHRFVHSTTEFDRYDRIRVRSWFFVCF